jgi:hypothetical protein
MTETRMDAIDAAEIRRGRNDGNCLGDDGAERGHARRQPGRHASAMEG